MIEHTGRFFTRIYSEISNSNDLTSLFKHVAKYCAQLNNSVVSGNETFEYRPFTYEVDLPKNHNLNTLTLDGSLPSLKQLGYILNQLPSLKNLVLNISPLSKKKEALNGVIFPSIYLPDISLECL